MTDEGSGTTPIWKRVLIAVQGSSPQRWRPGWMDVSGKAMGVRALNAAIADIGYAERPQGSNKQKFGKHWGEDGVAWCGLAVARWWQQGGFEITKALALMIDYVPELVDLAEFKKYGLSLVHWKRVRKGDAVAYDFPTPDGIEDHTGLFERWINKSAGTFYAIEGNTAVGNDAAGGRVMRRERSLNNVKAFVRKLPG